MKPTTTPTGEIVPEATTHKEKLMVAIRDCEPYIERLIPRHMSPTQYVQHLNTIVTGNPKLAECTLSSIFSCAFQLAAVGLVPNTPTDHAYLIPRGKVCTYQLGYKGVADLIVRSGRYSGVESGVVYPDDEFEYAYGLQRVLRHVPLGRTVNGDDYTHAWALAIDKDNPAASPFVVLSADQVHARRARSASFRGGRDTPWKTDQDAMRMKTAVHALRPRVTLSPEVIDAINREDLPAAGKPTAGPVGETIDDFESSMEIRDDDPARDDDGHEEYLRAKPE